MSILHYMTEEHRECDTLFANAEEAVALGEWEVAGERFQAFLNETLLHFDKEEDTLFPAFEKQTGMTEGPTKVMRYEHEQVRGIMANMAKALESKDKDAYLSLAESAMILLQQHNMKEKQMLYAMCDKVLPADVKENTLDAMNKMSL